MNTNTNLKWTEGNFIRKLHGGPVSTTALLSEPLPSKYKGTPTRAAVFETSEGWEVELHVMEADGSVRGTPSTGLAKDKEKALAAAERDLLEWAGLLQPI